jgi:ABC-type lipoprotein release transport system permease subunit
MKKIKKLVIGSIIGVIIGMWLGINIGKDRPILSNPFAEPALQEKLNLN